MTLFKSARPLSTTPVISPLGVQVDLEPFRAARLLRQAGRLDRRGIQHLHLGQAAVVPREDGGVVRRGGVEVGAGGNAPFLDSGDIDARQLDPAAGRRFLGARAHPVLDLANRVQLHERLRRFAARGARRVHVRFDQAGDDGLPLRVDDAGRGADELLHLIVGPYRGEHAVLDRDRLGPRKPGVNGQDLGVPHDHIGGAGGLLGGASRPLTGKCGDHHANDRTDHHHFSSHRVRS